MTRELPSCGRSEHHQLGAHRPDRRNSGASQGSEGWEHGHASVVQWSRTPAFQAGDTGSNPVARSTRLKYRRLQSKNRKPRCGRVREPGQELRQPAGVSVPRELTTTVRLWCSSQRQRGCRPGWMRVAERSGDAGLWGILRTARSRQHPLQSAGLVFAYRPGNIADVYWCNGKHAGRKPEDRFDS